ncbi:MAG: hypothetical protein N4A35_06200 [Flavobacteriales bacterium]|jgi:hypothetical protein|nr:hypothetical protein [Flavobacteriales bacterium]
MKTVLLLLVLFYVPRFYSQNPENKVQTNQSISASEYQQVDSSFLNKPVKNILKRLYIDKENLITIYEPQLICRGFELELKDSSSIFLFIERTPSIKSSKLLKQKIVGYGVAPMNKQPFYIGEGKPLMFNIINKYH